MDFDRMRSFVTVVECGKYVDAAQKLYQSQSALSKRIDSLEAELGCTLLKKTRDGVEPTLAGREFYGYARDVLKRHRTFIKQLEQYRHESQPTLCVGTLPLSEDYGFADLVGSFWESHPRMRIEFSEHSQVNLLNLLDFHRIDLAIARIDLLPAQRYDFEVLNTDEMVVVCNELHRLARQGSVGLEDLRNETFVLLDKTSDITRLFERACIDKGFAPNVPLYHARHGMVLKTVSNGLGISVMPRQQTVSSGFPNLVSIPFSERFSTTIGFVWNKGTKPSEAAREFMRVIKEGLGA